MSGKSTKKNTYKIGQKVWLKYGPSWESATVIAIDKDVTLFKIDNLFGIIVSNTDLLNKNRSVIPINKEEKPEKRRKKRWCQFWEWI